MYKNVLGAHCPEETFLFYSRANYPEPISQIELFESKLICRCFTADVAGKISHSIFVKADLQEQLSQSRFRRSILTEQTVQSTFAFQSRFVHADFADPILKS